MRQNGSEPSGGQMQINSWLGFAEREEPKTKTALPAGAKRSGGYIQFPAGGQPRSGAAPCTERSDANGPDFRKSGPGLAERTIHGHRPCTEVRRQGFSSLR